MTNEQLMMKAGRLLMDAAGMLRMEAEEWRNRKSEPPKNWTQHADAGSWADRCDRIAQSDLAAATAMNETAKRIAEATTDKAA